MCRYRFYIGRPNSDRKWRSDQEPQTIIGVTSSTDTICMYAEFLALQFKSSKFFEKLLKWRAVTSQIRKRTMGHLPQQRFPVKMLMLTQIFGICDTLGSIRLTFKFVFLTDYFGFLGAFNIAPATLVNLTDAATHVAATFSSDHPSFLCFSSGPKQPGHSRIITSYPSPQ